MVCSQLNLNYNNINEIIFPVKPNLSVSMVQVKISLVNILKKRDSKNKVLTKKVQVFIISKVDFPQFCIACM